MPWSAQCGQVLLSARHAAAHANWLSLFFSVWECFRLPGETLENMKHVTITVVLWLITLIIGLSTDDLGVVLELTGGTGATFLGFIFPATIYLQLEPGPPIMSKETLSMGKRMGAIGLFVLGVFAMFLSTGLTIKNASHGHGQGAH